MPSTLTGLANRLVPKPVPDIGASGTEKVVFDPWSGLDHKEVMRSTFDGIDEWVPVDDKRRLQAYQVITGYLKSTVRRFLSRLADDGERENAWQEFGDPKAIIGRIAAGVVGEDPTIAVIGADTPIPDEPDIRPPPTEPEPTGMAEVDAVRTNAFTRALQLWVETANAIIERWERLIDDRPCLTARQDWLRQWADDTGFIALLVENETENIVGLGSGIYVLGWDEDRQRPQVEIYEPDAYFPVIDDARPSNFPERVNLAWGLTRQDGKDTKRFVRRIAYDLLDIRGLDRSEFELGDPAGYLEDPEDQTHVSLLTDMTFPVEAFRDTTLNDITQGGVPRTIIVDDEAVPLVRYPIGYDFLPVVHATHNLAARHHFGESPVVGLAQLFDEIQASDTDESMSSRWAARPPAAVSGMAQASGDTDAERRRNNTIDVRPGSWFKVKEGGGVDVIEMAASMEAIRERIKELLKRLSVNGQVPEGLIGRVDASEVPSGLALTLSFTSFEQMVEGARLARQGKYRLLLKMIQRIQIHHAGGFPNDDGEIEETTEVFPAEVAFGSFMPQDLAGTIQLAKEAVTGFIMSQETAIRFLAENGVDVDDPAAELAAIRFRMGEEAENIGNALGDPQAAADFLGLRERQDDSEGETEPEQTEPGGTQVGADVGGPGVIGQ